MYALAGVARAGATRSGYVSSAVYFAFDGVPLAPPAGQPHVGVLLDSLSITDVLDETPNSCRFRTNAFVPPAGSEVHVRLGSKQAAPLFAGFALDVQQLYVGDKPANVQAEVSAADYTWFLGFLKVTKQYRSMSATAIAQDLVATFAGMNGFTSNNVAVNLPYLDEITYTDEDLPNALTRLARRIGAYWYVDYAKDVHLFFEETRNGAPADLTPSHKSLAHFTHGRDRSQALSRVYVEGRGSRLLSHVPVGDTMVPLETVVMFDPVASDVLLKLSFQGSEGGAQHLAYSGVVPGGGGSVVGPGVGPATAPKLALAPGAGLSAGTYTYTVTFTTASGESLPAPSATIANVGVGVADPTVPPANPWNNPQSGMGIIGSTIPIGVSCQVAYAYSTAATATALTAITLAFGSSANVTTISNNDPSNPSQSRAIYTTVSHSPDARVTWIICYLFVTGAGWGAQTTFALQNNPTLGASGGVSQMIYYAIPPITGLPSANTTASQNQVQLTTVPIGGTGVTGRKLYRTAANQTQLKFLASLSNNTSTTYLDAVPDASLGANLIVNDTSGLLQPQGQLNAGATTAIVAGASLFNSAGGWAIIGNGEQVIRYSGTTATTLIGIPATGVGAVTSTVEYGSSITAPPMLTGIPSSGPRSITRALTAGDEIYLVVQCDDPATQAGIADMVNVGPGIREEWVQDRRLSIAEARARGHATLKTRPLEQTRVGYTCRDLLTAAGKTITVNLPAPTNVSGTFKIQSVTIGNFRPFPTQPPTFTVEASSQRFSFDDWLRVLKTEG